jgi:phospholipid/cholesterol/gamma-HCH transport system permease protein
MITNSLTNNPPIAYRLEDNILYLSNSLTINAMNQDKGQLLNDLSTLQGHTVIIDLSNLEEIDSAGVAYLQHIDYQLTKKNKSVERVNIPEKIQKTIDIFSVSPPVKKGKGKKGNFIDRIGEHGYHFLNVVLRDYFYLLADLFYWSMTDFFGHDKARRKGESVNQAVLIGVNAVPIVGLISLLIGLVLALQSAAQLRQFGANIFIVDLIVIAMTREMGPLITAIMIAGRSGSAIASEVGTMVITEEIDALKSMSLNPVRYVVVPKMYASVFTLPFLTILADFMGILGGLIVSYFYLDLSVMTFYNRMATVLFTKDIFTGTFKSIIFAILIVQTGSYYGFHVKGGSEAVGRYTTAAVVTSIFLVILADSILGLLFY